MTSFKLNLLLLLLLIIEYPRRGMIAIGHNSAHHSCLSVTSECPQAFPSGDVSSLCYVYKRNTLSWTDAYNQCLAKTVDGVLIQVFSTKQFDALKTADISSKGYFWLGANNFASCKWNDEFYFRTEKTVKRGESIRLGITDDFHRWNIFLFK